MTGLFAISVVASLVMGPRADGAWRAPELMVRSHPELARADEVRTLALSYVGRPYASGGVGSPGFDCSGLTCRVFAEIGLPLPRVSRDQARAGRPVSFDALRPGDLLFFARAPRRSRINHVAIYLGDGEMVHASTGEGEVVVASVRTRWFDRHFVGARRVLPDESNLAVGTSSIARTLAKVESVELEEHSGEDALPLVLRRPPGRRTISFGPSLDARPRTAVGLRSAMVSELGRVGVTVAPEVSLHVPAVALDAALVLPIRFEMGRDPTIGAVKRVADVGRFVRNLSLGLRGADLELRLSQLGDFGLLSGLVVDKVAPGVLASGVPGLSLGRTPVLFSGRLSVDAGMIEGVLDDVFDPGLAGVAIELPFAERLRGSVGFSTDQHATIRDARRAVSAVEVGLGFQALRTDRWALDLSLMGAGMQALGREGALGLFRAFVQHRLTGASRLRLAARGGYVGPRAFDALFSATYLAARDARLEALDATRGRPVVGGEAEIAIGALVLGALYEDGLGRDAAELDRRSELLAEARGLPLGGTRLLDLRVAYGARGLFGARPEDVLHATAALRLESWLSVEAYLEHGARTEGGGGLAVALEP